jgi:purine-binding chemotaxis protein CheW
MNDSGFDNDTVAAAAASQGDVADTVYGVLLLGPLQFALPAAALREVIPAPDRFSALPAQASGLLGAVSMRGRIVPVLDLRIVLGLSAPRQPAQVVVVLRHAGALIGLLTDGVCGLTRLGAGRLDRMTTTGAPLLFSGSFERSEDASVVSVLDPAALMQLPGLPWLSERSGDAAASRRGSTERRALMLVRCGPFGLALDVHDIHTTLPQVTLLPSSVAGRVCRGVVAHAGLHLPAVDPLVWLALGQLPSEAPCQALVLRRPAGLVALLVNQVIDIVQVPRNDLLGTPELALRRPTLFGAMLQVAGHGEHLLLDSTALRDDPDLSALAQLNVPAGAGPAAARSGLASASANANSRRQAIGQSVITYEIGAEVASRLSQVSEVLTMPTAPTRPDSPHPAVLGLFSHRGQAVTLVCLASLLGVAAQPADSETRVLLVNQDGASFGFAVPRLCHIDETVWEENFAPRDRSSGQGPRSLGAHAVVELGQGAQRRTLHLIDLQALARSLLGTETPLHANANADTGPADTGGLPASAIPIGG